MAGGGRRGGARGRAGETEEQGGREERERARARARARAREREGGGEGEHSVLVQSLSTYLYF